jgi:hypothetical protein
VTAAFIPFPNTAPAVPVQGSDAGMGSYLETAEAGVANADALTFAQLVDGMIGTNSLSSNELSSAQGNVASSADALEGADSDHTDDPAVQGARPDLALAATVLLPTPVPIPVPRIEPGRVTGPDLRMDEGESSNSGDGATGSDPIAASVGPSDSTPWPAASAGPFQTALELPAETSPPALAPETEFAGAIRMPDAAERSGRRPSSAQSLAFALRLTGMDKSAQIESSALQAGPRAAEDLGVSEAAKDITEPATQPEISMSAGAATRSGSRTSGAPARSIVGNIPTASVQTASRDAGTGTADAATDSSKSSARTNSDQEAGSPLAKVRAADETGAAWRESEQTAAPVRSTIASVATTTTTAVPAPPAGAASRPSQTGSSDVPATARTESTGYVDTARGEKTPTRTARDILVQVPVQDGRKVEVQVAERGGEVRVAVRTADPELNQSLRVELGSLVSRLETAGYKADSFAPSESFVSSSSSARQDPSSSQQDASRGFSGRGQGSSGQGENRERRRESETLPWAEQFASNLSPGGEIGKESHSWQSIFSR